MFILGLTGSIGMGKSTAAALLKRLGVPVHDADASVHKAMVPGGRAAPLIDERFPGVVKNGVVDRQALGARVFGQPAELKALERILHPLAAAARDRFLAIHRRRGTRIVVLDVPLLFESGSSALCDGVVVVTAPAFLQRQRVLRRPGMNPEKFDQVLARQLPDADKRFLADWVVPTGLGKRRTLTDLKHILRRL